MTGKAPVESSAANLPPALAPVIEGGYCVGCGACAAVNGSPMAIHLDAFGRYVATASGAGDADTARVEAVCPFSSASTDEDVIGSELYPDAQHDPRIGRYRGLYAGHVAEGEYRTKGSSGGLGTWILVELFRKGLIDGVIHVRPTGAMEPNAPLFDFGISCSTEEILGRAKSSYYPVEMSAVLAKIRETPGRYALVGLPCFVKAVRLLARQEPVFRERIVFAISLVCGHLKSTRYAAFMAWQAGITPDRLRGVVFRRKVVNKNANDYGMTFVGEQDNGTLREAEMLDRDIWGSSWGYGFFMYGACEFCDDVLGETADITIGDAWLKPYVDDWCGSNVVVVRHPVLADLVKAGVDDGRLAFDSLGVEEVVQTQAGCFRQRRDGLAYRLLLKERQGLWHPPKRIAAREEHLTPRLRAKYAMRTELLTASHAIFAAAVEKGDFAVARAGLEPLMRQYDRLDRPAFRRFLSFCKRSLKKLLGLS